MKHRGIIPTGTGIPAGRVGLGRASESGRVGIFGLGRVLVRVRKHHRVRVGSRRVG